MMRQMGSFANSVGRYAGPISLPDVAVVLPQSLQLSVLNRLSLEAQQNCVRALYGYARSQAYLVGEDQLDRLGDPKLIIVPSPWVLESSAWQTLLGKVRAGAVLLISGPFDSDPHFARTSRAAQLSLSYETTRVMARGNQVVWPAGTGDLLYSGGKSDFLNRAILPDGASFAERSEGAGRILFSALPLELSDSPKIVGEIYSYALEQARARPVYTTQLKASGLTICPTVFPHATLYVLSSEADRTAVSFKDERSRKELAGVLDAGRAALLLVSDSGELLDSYNWPSPTR